MELNPDNPYETDGECGGNFIEVLEGEGLDGPIKGQWCEDIIPLPITSTGNTLTVYFETQYDFLGHFALTYTVLNSGKRRVSRPFSFLLPGELAQRL